MASPRHPARLSALLERALARFNLDRRLDDYRVWQAWDEVVGRTISRNAQPVRLDGSRLIVAVRSSTWLQELSLLQRELVTRLNEWMQREVVRELFFVVGRVEGRAPEPDRTVIGEPQGRRRRDELAPASDDQPPAADDLGPEAAATFERLWRAARARSDDSSTAKPRKH